MARLLPILEKGKQETDPSDPTPHAKANTCAKGVFLMSGYLGSIGFAFPAALGACAATNRKRHAITVGGDGGFAQYMAELVASVKYNMNIKLILLDNSELGKITKEQPSGGFEKFAFNLIHLDFAGYTNNYRAVGIKVTSKNEHETKMTQILNHPETTLLEIINDVNLV